WREAGRGGSQAHEGEGFSGPPGVRARAARWIAPALREWLAARPARLELECAGKRLLAVHSTPWEPRGAYVYPHSGQLARFAEADAEFVLYGHTHHQLLTPVGPGLVVNPGPAGEPRDPGNGRRLSCAVLDTASEAVAIRDFD